MAKQKQKNNAPNIGQQLLDALTQEEITQFVNALLAVLSAKLQEEAIAHLPKNTQQTIQQILAPTTPAHSTSSHTAPTASLAKQQDTWSQHWRKWDSILREAEKERGKYIVQEVHWEPPYFDTTAFAEDLDKVAEKMQPLVQTAFEHEFQPNHGFGDALLEAEAAVSGALEEWMEIDGLYLEQHVTLCFLQWEWLISQEQEQNAFEFVQEICNYETQAPNLELDRHTLLDFLTQLPDADQHCILEGLTANQATPFWQDALDKVHSHWHELYLLLLEQYAPDYYLENLRQTISQEWENGLPVIEALLAEQNYAESWTVIQDMLNALLKSKQVQHWTPDQSLWVHYLGFYAEGEATDVGRLMQFYQQTARGLRKPGVANALAVQQVAIAQWF
ncbi:MAG: hypothetical protein MUF49_22730, partial [Oculatellaceae cyanobacterium Prado106]|nr:hypothetical protein [Oculatellaceae cyanobacterium Prado106]